MKAIEICTYKDLYGTKRTCYDNSIFDSIELTIDRVDVDDETFNRVYNQFKNFTSGNN